MTKKYDDFQRDQDKFEGYFGDESAVLFDIFLDFQESSEIEGDMLEIGVYKGRSAFMSGLHLRDNENFYLIDSSYFFHENIENLKSTLGQKARFHQDLSQKLTPEVLGVSKGCIRWVHIDGEHTGRAVWNDLSLCEPLLSDDGILVIDDFFNPAYPQITESMYRFLGMNPYSLSLILTAWNKAYLARPLYARHYLKMIRSSLADQLHQRNIDDFMICKSSTREETPAFGISHRWQDRDYYGLDNSPDDVAWT